MNQIGCPACGSRLSWGQTLRQIFGPGRSGSALWGVTCPHCGADLKVPNGRVMLIFAAGIFFGSQTSLLLTLGDFNTWQTLTVRLLLILGFYAIAGFFFFSLEEVT